MKPQAHINHRPIVLTRGPVPSQADHLHPRGLDALARDIESPLTEPARAASVVAAADSLSPGSGGNTHAGAFDTNSAALEGAVDCYGPVRADRRTDAPVVLLGPGGDYAKAWPERATDVPPPPAWTVEQRSAFVAAAHAIHRAIEAKGVPAGEWTQGMLDASGIILDLRAGRVPL